MITELSIIIPALNEEQYLPKLLESIVLQKFQGKLEVIVVDGGSKDKTREVAHQFNDKLDLTVLTTAPNIGHQRNVGAQKAQYNHLLFIDADIIIPKGMLNKYLNGVDPKKRLVGRILFWPTKANALEYTFFIPAYLFLHLHSLIQPITSGGFLLTTKENFIKVGGFIDDALMGEDVEFGKRSVKDGAVCYTNYWCFVYHSSRRSQKMGFFRMIGTYLTTYLYFQRHGVVPNTNTFYYPYGQYEGYY